MPSSRPFIDVETGSIDRTKLLVEAVPLAKLILFFVAVAAVPFALVFFLGNSIIGALLAVVGQVVLALGAGIILIYAVVRGLALAGVPRRDDGAAAPRQHQAERPERGRSGSHDLDGNEQEAERAERERRDSDGDSPGSKR